MRSFKLLLLFSCVLSARAALTSAQDAIDPDNDALVNRVKKEIDALVLSGDKARAERAALEENGASLREAREAANAPLPADPGEIAVLERLDEASLLHQVELRGDYLTAYRQRKQQLDRIPSLTGARRNMLNQAMATIRIAEQRAGDLRPLLTELARRIKAGRISPHKAIFGDNGVDFWTKTVVQQRVDYAAWLETYSTEKLLQQSRPAAEPPSRSEPTSRSEADWNLETDLRLQHSLDVAVSSSS